MGLVNIFGVGEMGVGETGTSHYYKLSKWRTEEMLILNYIDAQAVTSL